MSNKYNYRGLIFALKNFRETAEGYNKGLVEMHPQFPEAKNPLNALLSSLKVMVQDIDLLIQYCQKHDEAEG